VVPERYPGSNWLTGSQHQGKATLSTRSSRAHDTWRPFSCAVAARQGHVQLARFMVGGRNFADLTPRLAHVTTCVHPEGHKLRPGEHGIESGLGLSRARETAGWTLAICFDIAADTNMDAAERVLRQSYDVIKRQQTMTASKSAGGRRRPARSTGRSTRSVPPSRPI
jgi:hypothetical protein